MYFRYLWLLLFTVWSPVLQVFYLGNVYYGPAVAINAGTFIALQILEILVLEKLVPMKFDNYCNTNNKS